MYERIDEDYDNVSLYESDGAPREDKMDRYVLRHSRIRHFFPSV